MLSVEQTLRDKLKQKDALIKDLRAYIVELKASKDKKRIKELEAENERLKNVEAFLRLEILNRATEFANQTQVTFGLVDHIFDEDFSRTKGEAKARWEFFKEAIHECDGNHSEVFERIGVEVEVTPEKNTETVMKMWEDDRKKYNLKRGSAA